MKTRLWTAWIQYFATGEGVTIAAVIGYAKTKKEAKQLFTDKFGEYLAIGCEVEPGIVRNEVVELLFSKTLLKRLKDNDGNSGALEAHAEYHVNKS
jgi:hypothetical protein